MGQHHSKPKVPSANPTAHLGNIRFRLDTVHAMLGRDIAQQRVIKPEHIEALRTLQDLIVQTVETLGDE